MAENHNTKETFHLRDYQRECLVAIKESYRAGIRRQLICLPTGTGKTVIFASFPGFFHMKKQMLVLAHRAELLDQARNKISQENPGLKIEIEQADKNADPDCDVVIASVPTLGRKDSSRLKKLDPNRFFLIVVDEAHHSTAESYIRIFKYFGLFEPETIKLLVGFTATPKRGDGQGLNAVFQEIVFSRSLPEMIKTGYLSPVAGYRIETHIDLSRVRTRMGDFISSQLSMAVNIKERNELVVEIFRSRLKNRKTLVFCVDVAHACCLSETFNANGIPSAHVSGEMDRKIRKEILNDFHTGKIQVLTNCMVLTEGYDEPSVDAIILSRPTKSVLLYTQMIGRGTRLHSNKEDVIIIDIVDNTRDHKLATLPPLFGLSEEFNLEGHTTAEAQKAIDWVETNRPWVNVNQAISLSELRYMCRKINLFDLATPDELMGFSKFAWTSTGKGGYQIGLSGGNVILVEPTILKDWEIIHRNRIKEEKISKSSVLRFAIIDAERYIKEHYRESVVLVSRNTRWRKEPASEKQLLLLKSKKMDVPDTITKGQASHLIGMISG